MSDLKDRISSEMLSDYSSSLERNFEIAKKYIRVTTNSTIEIINKEKYNGEDLILIYCIGKQYSKEAEISESSGVSNRELQDELGKPSGSILPWLKSLRDKKKLLRDKTKSPIEHFVPLNQIEPILLDLEKKH